MHASRDPADVQQQLQTDLWKPIDRGSRQGSATAAMIMVDASALMAWLREPGSDAAGAHLRSATPP
jgi:hypothetical protein